MFCPIPKFPITDASQWKVNVTAVAAGIAYCICMATRWPFAETNELIERHNEWYPIERRLPVNPRTGEYVLIAGRSYRREPLTPAWALGLFPPEL